MLPAHRVREIEQVVDLEVVVQGKIKASPFNRARGMEARDLVEAKDADADVVGQARDLAPREEETDDLTDSMNGQGFKSG